MCIRVLVDKHTPVSLCIRVLVVQCRCRDEIRCDRVDDCRVARQEETERTRGIGLALFVVQMNTLLETLEMVVCMETRRPMTKSLTNPRTV